LLAVSALHNGPGSRPGRRILHDFNASPGS
jgi:hypothetical protein